jgi:hypothetical protein
MSEFFGHRSKQFLKHELEMPFSIFFTDDLTSSMSDKRFSFSTFVNFGNSQKSAEPSQETTADDS